MATDKDQFQAPSTESVEAGYELSTVNVKGLLWFVIGLILTAAIVHAGIWFLFQAFTSREELVRDRPTSALTDRDFRDEYNKRTGAHIDLTRLPPPPPPRLQPNPHEEFQRVPAADLADMYQKEDAMFRQLGWNPDERDPARIAIPQAVLDAVIRAETQKQQQEKPTASAAGPSSSRVRGRLP